MDNNTSTEHKRASNKFAARMRSPMIIAAVAIIVVAAGIFGVAYLKASGMSIYTDKAEISADVTNLAPTQSGTLEEVFVNPGDQVAANTVVARVGNELIKTTSSGIIASTNDSVGALVNPGQTVVSMIDPADLRVVGHIDENKGLSDIEVGDRAEFTVDAFGSKKFDGIVDEVSPVSRQGDVVFNISDKRETSQFDVKVRFDTSAYPELKNGMSAKLHIYKD
jgi:multidrug resistance efflux pump